MIKQQQRPMGQPHRHKIISNQEQSGNNKNSGYQNAGDNNGYGYGNNNSNDNGDGDGNRYGNDNERGYGNQYESENGRGGVVGEVANGKYGSIKKNATTIRNQNSHINPSIQRDIVQYYQNSMNITQSNANNMSNYRNEGQLMTNDINNSKNNNKNINNNNTNSISNTNGASNTKTKGRSRNNYDDVRNQQQIPTDARTYNQFQLLNRPSEGGSTNSERLQGIRKKLSLEQRSDRNPAPVPNANSNKANTNSNNNKNSNTNSNKLNMDQYKHKQNNYKLSHAHPPNMDIQQQRKQINQYFNNQSDEGQQLEDQALGQEIQFNAPNSLFKKELQVRKVVSKEVLSASPGKRVGKVGQYEQQQHKRMNINDISSLHQREQYGREEIGVQSKQFKMSSVYPIRAESREQNTTRSKQFQNSKQTQKSSITLPKRAPNPIKPLPILQPSLKPTSKPDLNHTHTRYGPGGIQTLQFNPQNQKLVILDSKQTQGANYQAITQFCGDFSVPVLGEAPTPEKSPEELVAIAKREFIRLGCQVTEMTVINVRKYKNCVHFNVSNEHNILYHFQNGKTYYGSWKMLNSTQGQKHGQGIQTLPGKYKFKGLFHEGKKSGYGTLICCDGTAYVGYWQNGLRHGLGRQLDADMIVYEGEWKQGKKNGYGKLVNFVSGKLEFQGVFVKGLKNGYGKEYFVNGDMYDGNYVNHKFQGQGTYYWKSGATYIGEFFGGRRNGYGIWKSGGENFDTYEGEYLDDKKHGSGVYKWANGSKYQGEFRQDLKHGVGKITYENGKVANLNWIKGKAQKKVNQEQLDELNTNLQQMSQRKSRVQNKNAQIFHSKSKNNFILRNRVAARSTQNLNSARSSSTNNSQNPKGITFHTRSAIKLKNSQPNPNINLNLIANTNSNPNSNSKVGATNAKVDSNLKKGQEIIRLKFDNKQFEKAIGKNWNKTLNGLKINSGKETFQSTRPDYPKDRPYRGIQFSSNANMEF